QTFASVEDRNLSNDNFNRNIRQRNIVTLEIFMMKVRTLEVNSVCFCPLLQVQYPQCLSGSVLANCNVHPSLRNKS
ncbi:unnamed protein product, partial [Bubo scandiacus]